MIPDLSVVMPVHNTLPYLDEAIGSILRQSFAEFEFVILDDGSTDGSGEVLRAWAARDARIRLIHSGARSGPAGSSNAVVAASSGALIARMDADDIAHPDRLRRQMELFVSEPDAVLAGVLHDTVDHAGIRVRAADRARAHRRSLFPPFAHGSMMMRRSVFNTVGGYRAACNYWEDVDLCLRMAAVGRVFVIPEPLFSHRLSATSTRIVSASEAVVGAYGRMYRYMEQHPAGNASDFQIPASDAKRLPADAFILLGSPAVWAGRSPRLAKLFLRRARVRWNRRSMLALAWMAWATISPRSLRLFLKALLRVRNRHEAPDLCDKRWIAWSPLS